MGDKQNTIKKLQGSARSIKFADKLDFEQVSNGSPKEYLKLYQYLFCEYNPAIAAEVTGKHQVELAGKEDKPFMECIYRLIRDMFDYVPKLTRDQFFSSSYAQVKATMAIDIIDLVQKKIKTPQTAGSSSSASSSSAASSNTASSTAQVSSQMNTSTNGSSTGSGAKASKASAKSESSSEKGVSKPVSHNLPPKATRTLTNGSTVAKPPPNPPSSASVIGPKLEGLLSRLELVEKYCQEISRDKSQSKDSRTFKDDEEEVKVIESPVKKPQELGAEIQYQIVKSYESEMTKWFEGISTRISNIERNLFNFELTQKIYTKKLDDYLAKQDERKSLKRNNSFSTCE